jgi:glycosyltransferase involved in cell wall biosynthesis
MIPENLKRKILLITRPIAPPWDEASKNFAYYLAKNVTKLEFGLLTNGILPDLSKNILQKPIYTSNDFNFFQKFRLVKNLRKLKKEFDILHFLFTPTKFNVFLMKYLASRSKNSRIKTIQTVATLREDLYSEKEIRKLMFGDLIVTYSDYAKNKLNRLGFDNVRRIYPGIDLEEFQKTEKDKKIMFQKNISEKDFVINFTGEYSRLGAIDVVIDSFLETARQIPDIKLVLAVRIKNKKDATKKEEVIAKLKKNGLLERVCFFDNGRYAMPSVYNLCDISLFPVSNMKGKFDIPLAVVEAMACKKPVILSDLPILSELNNKRNSVIIKKDDEKKLSNAVLDLYRDSEKRIRLGNEARKFAEENFNIKNISEMYQKIYEEL